MVSAHAAGVTCSTLKHHPWHSMPFSIMICNHIRYVPCDKSRFQIKLGRIRYDLTCALQARSLQRSLGIAAETATIPALMPMLSSLCTKDKQTDERKKCSLKFKWQWHGHTSVCLCQFLYICFIGYHSIYICHIHNMMYWKAIKHLPHLGHRCACAEPRISRCSFCSWWKGPWVVL